uniref:Uncharacterized protein n=1 Tax=Lepeophtheirus salmonis TaxID=72036 RepID=A0A0K2TCK3_LEPSM
MVNYLLTNSKDK